MHVEKEIRCACGRVRHERRACSPLGRAEGEGLGGKSFYNFFILHAREKGEAQRGSKKKSGSGVCVVGSVDERHESRRRAHVAPLAPRPARNTTRRKWREEEVS